MTRMVRLWSLLTGKEPPCPARARQAALDAYEAAVRSRDTREIRRTWLQLKEATCGELRSRRVRG